MDKSDKERQNASHSQTHICSYRNRIVGTERHRRIERHSKTRKTQQEQKDIVGIERPSRNRKTQQEQKDKVGKKHIVVIERQSRNRETQEYEQKDVVGVGIVEIRIEIEKQQEQKDMEGIGLVGAHSRMQFYVCPSSLIRWLDNSFNKWPLIATKFA